jgi:PAS domain S-box-containing protein
MERQARVLVTDRDGDQLQNSAKVLRGAGFEVASAGTAAAALETAEKVVPDVVLLDMLLPDLPGVEVCRRMKTNRQLGGVKIIHVWERMDTIPGIAAASLCEADSYLTRPIAPEVLAGSVRAMARLKEVEEQLRRSDQLWRTVFSATRESVLLIDGELKIVEANSRAADLFQHPVEELEKKPLLELCTYGSRESVSSHLLASTSEQSVILRAELVRNGAPAFPAEIFSRRIEIDSSSYFEVIVRNLEEEDASAEPAPQEMTREFDLLAAYVQEEGNPITAAMYAGGPISQLMPSYFEELAAQYDHILDLALQEKRYRIHHDLPEQLRQLAGRLGKLRAASRDVIELHTIVLKRKMAEGNPRKKQACNVEGRFMLVELLGRLATYYRDRAIVPLVDRGAK